MLINFPVVLFFRIHSAGYSVLDSGVPFGSNQRRAVIVPLLGFSFFLFVSQ